MTVLALRLDTDLDEGIGKTLDEIMLHEFQEVGDLQVLSSSDVLAILNMEEKRLKLGCSEDSCLVEIGGALGVPLLASASIGAVGDQYVINLKVLDVTEAAVLVRSSEIVPREDSELIKAVRKSVAKVVAAGGAAATLACLAGQDASAAREEYEGTSTWQDDKEAYETKALTADVLFGITGAAAITTVVLFVIGSGDEEPESPVSVAPTTGGGMATYSVRF